MVPDKTPAPNRYYCVQTLTALIISVFYGFAIGSPISQSNAA